MIAIFRPSCQVYGVAVNQLLGQPFGFFIVDGDDRDPAGYVAIVASEVGVVAAHFVPRPWSYLGGCNSGDRSQSLM